MGTSWLSAEHSNRKLMVALPTRELAEHTQSQLIQLFGKGGGSVSLIEPGDPKIEGKLEPETRRIALTALRSHGVMGAIGLIIGVLIWGGCYLAEMAAIVSAPWVSSIFIVFITTLLGLIAGGLFSFRPDHNAVIIPAKDASAIGKWVVVAHPTTAKEAQGAEDYLRRVDEESFTQTLG